MTAHSHALRGLLLTMLVVLVGRPAVALPTMIRLGYHECASCHVSPQGGGPLTPYGRGIDEAQSRRAGEYRPSDDGLFQAFAWGGRVIQDVRVVTQAQRAWTSHESGSKSFWPRFMYRNVTTIGRGFSVAGTITGQSAAPSRLPGTPADSLFVNTALVHYRAAPAFALAAGRDQLPSGINVPDLGAFIKARNGLGYADAPTQVKMFIGGGRWSVVPFAFASNRTDGLRGRGWGSGTLAEVDLFGRHTAVIGATLLHGRGPENARRTIGAYARLGFGQWGILAEHDFTDRSGGESGVVLTKHTTYAQLFWAAREWLVLSAIGERLQARAPAPARSTAGKLEVAARFTNQASVGVIARVVRDPIAGRLTTSASLQVALKSAQ
jgi:hypothetical protein